MSQHYPGKVIVAGRNYAKAEQLSQQIAAVPMKLDLTSISNSDFLDTVQLVIMCIDQLDTSFVELCIEKGINYIDISANKEVIEKIELLNDQAKQSSIVLSVGIAPGITNLLAKHVLNQSPTEEAIDISVLLGLGEKHGDAAFKWTFDNINTSYTLGKQEIRSFSTPRKTELVGKRSFYTFNFSDQHTLLKTTQIKRVTTRMAFDVSFLTKTVALLRKVGLTTVFNNRWVQNVSISLFKKSLIGSDVFGVKVEGKTLGFSVTGNGEGNATAYVATETALHLLKNQTPSGVKHLHEIIEDIPKS